MINVLDCKKSNYLSRLKSILEKRRSGNKINSDIAIKIVKDVKKNKQKALLKYEKKFSKNKQVKISKNELSKDSWGAGIVYPEGPWGGRQPPREIYH